MNLNFLIFQIDYTDTTNHKRTFGPIFNKTHFLKPLLELQNNIQNLRTEDGITLESICHKPLKQSSVCNIQSVLAYWQDDPNLLDETISFKTPSNKEINSTYLDHFLSCAG